MPWIELEGAVNVRDLGGLPTSDGGKTVGGRLLRATTCRNCRPLTSPRWCGSSG